VHVGNGQPRAQRAALGGSGLALRAGVLGASVMLCCHDFHILRRRLPAPWVCEAEPGLCVGSGGRASKFPYELGSTKVEQTRLEIGL